MILFLLKNEGMTALFGLADLFLTKITTSGEFFPYGLRWINKHIKRALKEKFKNATNAEIMPVLGYNYSSLFRISKTNALRMCEIVRERDYVCVHQCRIYIITMSLIFVRFVTTLTFILFV